MPFLKRTIWSFIHVNLMYEFKSNLMNEYAPGNHESLGTYTIVFFSKTQNDSSEKVNEIYELGQYISS